MGSWRDGYGPDLRGSGEREILWIGAPLSSADRRYPQVMPRRLRAVLTALVVTSAACHGHGGHTALHWANATPPIADDVDGDGVDDVIGTAHDGDNYYVVAVSGADGHELWRTADAQPAADHADALGVLWGAVMRPDKKNQIAIFDEKTGVQRAVGTTAGPVSKLCVRSLNNTAIFVTADNKVWTIDLLNGALAAISLDPSSCVLLEGADPRTIPNELATKPELQITGSTIDHAVSRGVGPMIVFGKTPAGRPELTFFDADQVQVGQVDVVAAESAPDTVKDFSAAAVDDRMIAVGYQHASGDAEVTAVARPLKKKGKHLWTASLGKKPVDKLTIGKDAVFAASDGLTSIDAGSGGVRWTVMQ